MADATNAGNVYVSIRADIRRLSKDLADAEKAAKAGAEKIQTSIDKGLDFERMKVAAVGAAAGIYSAFRTIGQAVESAKVGATLIKQAEAFDNLAAAAGNSSKAMLSSLRSSSRGLVAESDLMAASGKALLMNIPADKISELMKIAAATSRMTGQTITEAFNDITLGVARQSRMILDNLGIIVDVDAANEKYASSIGKTASALTDAEKKQAFMNATLAAGNDMIKRLGAAQSVLEGATQATVAWTESMNLLSKTIAQESNPLFEAVAIVLSSINEEMRKNIDSAKEYESYIGKIDARIAELNKKYGDMESRKSWGYNESQDVEYRRLVSSRRNMLETKWPSESGRFKSGYPAEAYLGSTRVLHNDVAYDPKKFDDFIQLQKQYETESERVAKKNAEFWEDYQKASGDAFESERVKLKQKYDEYAKTTTDQLKLDEWYAEEKRKIDVKQYADETSMREIANGSGFLPDESRYSKYFTQSRENQKKFIEETNNWREQEKRWSEQKLSEEDQMREFRIKAWKDEHDKYLAITQHTADACQDAMSDLFFDAMTGKLKTLEDYFLAFYQSIAKMASQYLSQQAMGGIMGLFGTTGSPITAGDRLGAMFTTNTPIAAGGISHLGGVIGAGGIGMRSIPASYYSRAPRLHSGLMPDEYPAILQKGEAVIPKGGSMGGGGDTYYYISAMDSQSIVDSLRRSGAVPMLAEENIRNNGGLRKTIQTRAR
jgi:DNA-binding phage protein